ncbi:hypothetical protein CDL15_Pgr000035 [Punica granatum]|uniref:Uncharacterized protein n=1 Tax=Punica granatum TaxID=22663 RepID=A0A218VRD9_PUNGR|nr:hypothetical protein CDL15_Pgr000035 [Punica granatum]
MKGPHVVPFPPSKPIPPPLTFPFLFLSCSVGGCGKNGEKQRVRENQRWRRRRAAIDDFLNFIELIGGCLFIS